MSDELLGQTLNGNYRIDQLLADGGMSRVYLAEQVSLSRKVALKVLAPGFEDQDFIDLFLREARINSHINHSNIVNVLDFGITESGIVFLAMEFLDGGTLDSTVDGSEGLMLSQVVWLFEQLCQGINAAHGLNVVHRDLKPGNIMLTSMTGAETVAKIVDFGISKPLSEEDLKHTQLGMIIGTPGFLAPEQICGARDLDARADIYALGAILHYCATGKKPFSGSNRDLIMQKQLKELPTPLADLSITDQDCLLLQPVINQAMAIDRDKRYANVGEFWQAILNCVEQTDTNKAVKEAIHLTHPTTGDEELYQLVYSGDVDPELDAEKVKNQLKRMFKITDKHIEMFLSGKRVVIRKNLPLAEVKKLERAIARTGLKTCIEDMPHKTQVISANDVMSLPGAKLGQPISIAQLKQIGTQPTPSIVEKRKQELSSFEATIATTGPRAKKSGFSFTKKLILTLTLLMFAAVATVASVERLRYQVFDAFYGVEPQRGISAETIKIGLSAPFKGSARELGRSIKLGIEAHFNEVNQAGGIHGRQLELVTKNDGYEPAKVIANSDYFFDQQDGVFAFLGNVGTPTNKAFLPYIFEEKTILFGAFTGANVLRKTPPDRYVFNYRASYKQELSALLNYFVREQGLSATNVGVLYQDDSFGRDGVHNLRSLLHHEYGIEGAKRLKVSAGYKRNTAQIDDAVSVFEPLLSEVDVIFIIGTYSTSAEFTRLVKQKGYQGQIANLSFVGTEALAETFRELGPEYGEGVVISQVVPMYSGMSNSARAFNKALDQFGQTREGDFVAFEGYIAAKLFTHALEKAGRNLSTDKLIDTLESLHSLDLGTGSSIGFKPSDHQASHLVWGSTINENGEIEALDLTE
ncbi:ABC transporter substrate-binding protein [Catenovulum sp. SM1970]|uniref:ABC transporter substrate-binding protein n=1 Tax=Marinifaba aquimaris TaxID=2741323 RepID=UPI00157386C6|nr:ABC transporter substrate-binding protein [Marinifaba aquimaris]NTS75789.1 ABC transporter substrate-binding protein [Marinifaba aquimaris]